MTAALPGAWIAVRALPFLLASGPSTQPAAQDWRPMGTVATSDALVSGKVAVQGGQAQLLNNVSVTAYDRTAQVSLTRGGDLLVCSTSEFHLLRSSEGVPLIFGLDRGAIELHTTSQTGDIMITPDLKLGPVTKGQYDLRVRVTREGDTCIDNAGAAAPVLNVTDPFSSATYRILPGQHLLFVKGDLHKVVDHERNSCGCPAAVAPQVATRPGQPVSPAQAAAAAHPFPEAQSAGLASTAGASNEAPVGTASSQVSTTFSYGENQGRPPSVGDTPASAATGGTIASVPRRKKGGFFHAIGGFFHRLFGGS